MLEHLRQRIENLFQGSKGAVLSTNGSLGLQAGHFPCEYQHERLYLLVPTTLDLLENLASPMEVLVTAPGWQVWGRARAISSRSCPQGLRLLLREEIRWSAVIVIQPIRVQLHSNQGQPAGETIDFDIERNEK